MKGDSQLCRGYSIEVQQSKEHFERQGKEIGLDARYRAVACALLYKKR
jgi:hypothetical protein